VKKLALASLIVILAVSTILGACAEPAPAPAPSPTPTPAPAPKTIQVPEQAESRIAIKPIELPTAPAQAEPPEKVYRLKFSDWGPAFIDIGVRAQEWAELIGTRSGGRVEIDCYFAEALLRRPDTIRGVDSGIADVVLYVLGGVQGVHQINRVIDLPGNGIPSQVAQQVIYKKLRDKYPELLEEFGNTFPLIMRGLPAEHIHTTGKFHLVRTPDDLAGLKTYANELWADQLGSKGASVFKPAVMEWYTSLDRNLIQGMFMHWLSIYSFGLVEVMKYHTMIGNAGTGMMTLGYLMNKESFAELPPDLQKIILDTSDEIFNMYREDDPMTEQIAIDQAKEMGNEIVYLTEEEQQQWFDLAKPIHEDWIAKSEAAGYANARDIYNDMMQMVKTYKEKGHL
jgi:TRAP-type C4-dicarboxylate transport system substrate-binding protein